MEQVTERAQALARDVAARLTRVEQRLHERGSSTHVGTLLDLAEAALELLPKTHLVDPAHELTESEREALLEGGADLTPRDWGERDPIARTAADLMGLLATSLTTTEAGEKLGVVSSRIRQRLGEHTMYGIRSGNQWHLPAFQFQGDRLVPGVEEVFPLLPQDLPPVVVFRWFTLPNVDLYVEELEKTVSPREWLLMGHPVEPVAELAHYL
jgi:hypothetical protein